LGRAIDGVGPWNPQRWIRQGGSSIVNVRPPPASIPLRLDTDVGVAVSSPPSERAITPRRPVRRVSNWNILPSVVGGALSHGVAGPRRLRRQLLKRLWIELKRFAAPHITNIEVASITGIDGVHVEGPVLRRSPLVLCALASLLHPATIFEFGTYRGDTAWLLARNIPSARVYTLDLGGPDERYRAQLELTDIDEYFHAWDRGARFHGTPEGDRITQLAGDSATFDFAPYRGKIDLAYVDASHSYSYVRSDTEAALAMLSPSGTIIWDDYTHYSGIYAYLNELAAALDHPIFHVLDTRLAVYSRRPITDPLEPGLTRD
jgi:predicted O-methyltransferase YrrM